MAVSDFLGGSVPLIAGPQGLALSDLVEMGPDGKGYPCKTTDYCTVANPGNIVADTTLTQTWSGTRRPLPFARGADGSIYLLTANSGSNGLVLNRYTAAGSLAVSITIDTGASNILTGATVKILNNGNVVVGRLDGTTAQPTFTIYGPADLSVKVGPTVVEAISGAGDVRISVLTGGNFAISYLAAAGGLHMAIYTQAGSTSGGIAAFVVDSTVNANNQEMAALSGGDVAITWTTNGPALKYAIYTLTGGVTKAVTTINAYADTGLLPSISALTGFFAIACASAANTWSVYVFNNAGAQQGATFSLAQTAQTGGVGGFAFVELANDGTQFFHGVVSGNGLYVSSVPTSGGAGAVSFNPFTSGFSTCNSFRLRADGNGFLVGVIGNTGANVSKYFVLQTAALGAAFTGLTSWGPSPGTTGPGALNLILPGDFAFIAYYDITGGSTVPHFAVIKFANSVIEGVCIAAAAAGASASVQPCRFGGGAAAFGINSLGGTASKQFTHNSGSGSNMYGNKGVVSLNGCALLGVA